ncbi:MAG: hypothetical protein M3273_09425 [Actinomycetota bacterium]|nr:hypothetical protein [Actinomycetota bacterium]
MKIVFVCTGNICRSPMAEGMLRHELTRRGCESVEVTSCGTWGLAAQPATIDAQSVLAGRGIQLETHRSRSLDREEIREADLVIAMTSVHVREIGTAVPEAMGKVRLMKELVELEPDDVAAGASPEQRVEALLRATRPPPRRSLDVDDPMGLPTRAYERAAGEIEAGVEALADVLCPPGA